MPEDEIPNGDSTTEVIGEPEATDADGAIVADESDFIKISRKDLHAELGRLEREDVEFRQAIGTIAGRRNKAAFDSQLQEARLENQRLTNEFRRLEIERMPEEELKTRLKDDPGFAKVYGDLQTNSEQHQQNLELLRMTRSIESVLSTAEDAGIPSERVEAYRTAVRNGRYNNPEIDWPDQLSILQRDLMMEKAGVPSVRVPQSIKDDIVPPNDNLKKRVPDTSRGQSGNKYIGLTVEKIKTMSQDEVDAIPMETLQRVMSNAT